MTKMLASVNSVAEALLVLDEKVGIIDLKQPALGALGALDTGTVREIVTVIAKRRPISATIGDLPMQADMIFSAVQNMAETGVDYIKIGFFPEGDSRAVTERLAVLAQNNTLIAVLFADQQPDLQMLPLLKQAGFFGVMLDTLDKSQGSLCKQMPIDSLQHFVSLAKESHLLCGLAGSLSLLDIPVLLGLEPDYLGFRGALCELHNRTGQLYPPSVQSVMQAINHR